MEWRDNRKSALESVKGAIGRLLIDFKQWTMADTKAFNHWKGLPPNKAIQVAPSRMIDDVESMLSKYRQMEPDKGFTAPLPIMIVALAPMVSPPDVSVMRGVPYWLETVIPTDPKKRPVRLRTIPRQYRVQVAFICAEGDTCQSVINQFCAYMTDDFKRRFTATYEVGDGVKVDWELTVLENGLFPDSIPNDQKNMSINTVDFQVIGLLPQVVGLRKENGDDEYGDGVDLPGREIVEVVPGKQEEWTTIKQADLHDETLQPSVLRASADAETGERRIDRVDL